MKKMMISAVAVLAAASGALAQNAYWSSTTTGGPTFARPSSFTTTASFANAVNYDVQPFYVNVSGQYVYESSTAGASWDGYILVYANNFNPATPLANLIAGDDDFSSTFTVLTGSGSGTDASRIALGESSNFGGATTGLNLTAGVQYYAVQTAYSNGNSGTYNAGIGGGQGTVTLGMIPAPGSLALLGMGGFLAARRRR